MFLKNRKEVIVSKTHVTFQTFYTTENLCSSFVLKSSNLSREVN